MPRVSDIIIPDNRRRNSEQIAQAMQMYNMMKEQQSVKLRAEQEERKNRLEELRYKEFERKNKNDEQRQEEILRREKEREAKTIGLQYIKPIIDEQNKKWGAHKKIMASAAQVLNHLKKAEGSEVPEYYDNESLAGLDRLSEALQYSGRISTVHQGEREARQATVMSFIDKLKNKYALNPKDKKSLTPEMRKSFEKDIYDYVENEHYGYKNEHDNLEKNIGYYKKYMNPEYMQYMPQAGQLHQSDPTFKQFDDIYNAREEQRKDNLLRSIQSPVVQQNTDKYKPLYDKATELQGDPFAHYR